MSKLTDRVSYLKGLAEGLGLNPEKDSNRILLGILDVLDDISKEIDDIRDEQSEMSEYLESMDDDLADLEDAFYVDDEENDSDDEDDEEDDDEDEIITYECPHCGTMLEFRASEIDFEEENLCPSCGKPVFPEYSMEAGDCSEDGQDNE